MTDEIQELRDWSAGLMGWRRRDIEGVTCLQPTGVNVVWFTDDSKAGMTWRTNTNKTDPRYDPPLWAPDDPTTGQIWIVVQRMRELGWHMNLHEHPLMAEAKNKWSASFRNIDTRDYFEKYAQTPCLAILKAAKATEVE